MDLARADGRLIAFVDAIMAVEVERAGAHLACRPGCTECCVGPFPITQLEALRLRGGLRELAARDPVRAERLEARARDAAKRLSVDFPGDLRRGTLSSSEASNESFFARHEALACPALDPASGRCELYAFRPVSCRTFGPPVRIEGVALPPCRLCFTQASESQIESSRVEIDCARLEAPLLEGLAEETGLTGETLIAFALAGGARSEAVSHPGSEAL
ncbi:MAG: YkgJ family cysteine cluster protein [Acidobacteriota bacterium]